MPQNALALLTDLLCAHEAASSFGCGLEPHLIERMIDRHCCSVDMPVFAARAGENDQHFAAAGPASMTLTLAKARSMPGADPRRRQSRYTGCARPATYVASPAQHGRTRPGRPDELHISALGLDPFAHLTLMLMRWHFQTFAQPECHGWLMALRVATSRVGARGAGALCYDLVAVVQVLRAERSTAFAFNPQSCDCCRNWVTPEERRLMELIAALRAGQLGRARTTAQMLCDGAPSDALVMAMQSYLLRHDPTCARPACSAPPDGDGHGQGVATPSDPMT